MELTPLEFAMSYIQRSGRVDIERLRKLSPKFVERYERESRPMAIQESSNLARHSGRHDDFNRHLTGRQILRQMKPCIIQPR